ncbi:hypothetical protein R1flu_019751 [Riccia fluitans]|uniref:Deoxyuridine 5'-triphosphate nucleotidohydrolase n=1 Tax=Riccia fluitans TaxID=41844 RepID=A0ABD1ZJK3_9MARC
MLNVQCRVQLRTALCYRVVAVSNNSSWYKVHHLNKWKARGVILEVPERCPARTSREANRRSLLIWGEQGSRSALPSASARSALPSLRLPLPFSLREGSCVYLSTSRRSAVAAVFGLIRSSFSHFPMEQMSDVDVMDVKEPALKKQACDVAYNNGHSGEVHVAHSTGLRVKKLAPEAILPSRGSALAAGYDLSSAHDSTVPARGKALIKTELSIAVPEGTYGRVAPRSGIAWKNSIDVGAGVIDADYRGPLGVILFNHSDVDFPIKAGDRIAQLILERIITPEVMEVDDLDSTIRGEGGFGSTGVAIAPVVVVEAPAQA